MAANTANNGISSLVNSQVPFFVRNDHQTFVAFLQAYFAYLEQIVGPGEIGKAIQRRENMLKYADIDTTIEDFQDFLYTKFLKGFSIDRTFADKDVILKHAKDFYRAKGSEKSIRFLMRILFGPDQDNIEFYYPKRDILRASDGKWYIQKSLRVRDTQINGTANNTIAGLEKFAGKRVFGATSDASAIIESVNRFYQQSVQLDELILSDIKGTFDSGETISTTFNENGSLCVLSANVFGGVINSITITNPGTRYTTNDTVIIESSTGSNAVIRIAKVTAGNISAILVNDGGAGYQNGNIIVITGGGGFGANANVRAVSANNYAHPSSYNVMTSTISLEANTLVGNATYGNLNSLIIDPANNWVQNSVSYFTYANTGPVANVLVILSGQDFESNPSYEIQANSRVKSLGAIGKLKINNGGVNYAVGDILVFNNVPGGLGFGANGTVTAVEANGMIKAVALNASPTSTIVGGAGYNLNYLPTISINSSNTLNSGANVTVSTLLGYGGDFAAASATLGAIERMIIINEGQGYLTNPTINLKTTGDGTAQATVTTLQGIFSYPGRYINDDGFLSSYNFLEDRDYYQPFSYVIRARESIANYRTQLKQLVHPAGFKVFGEYMYSYNGSDTQVANNSPDVGTYLTNKATYISGNNLVINYTNHGRVANDRVYLDFQTGNIVSNGATVANISGEFVVKSTINANAFIVYSSTKTIGTLNVNALDISPQGVHIKDDGMRLYYIGYAQDRIREYTMSRPFDVTSATYVRTSPTFGTIEQTATDLEFKPDGTRVYITGDTNNMIYQLKVDEAWNASTINVTSGVLSYNVNAYETNPHGLRFNPSGNMMYLMGLTSDRFWQFSLSESWNVNTATLYTQSNTTITTAEGTPTDFIFTNNGSSILVIGQATKRIQLYNLKNAYNVNTIYFVANTSNLNIINATGMEFSNNGTVLYVVDDNTDSIIQLPLSQAYNVFTAPVYYATSNTRAPTGNVNFTRIVT